MAKSVIGVDSGDPFLKLVGANTADAMIFKYDDSAETVKLNRDVSGVDTEIMTINPSGHVSFKQNVSFDGGSSTISAKTVSIEDTQFEIGLSDSVNITAVSNGGQSGAYTYTFTYSANASTTIGATWTYASSGAVWTCLDSKTSW